MTRNTPDWVTPYVCHKCGGLTPCHLHSPTTETERQDLVEDAYKALQATVDNQTQFLRERRVTQGYLGEHKPKPSIKLVDNKVVIGDVEIEMDGCHVDGAEFHDGKLKVRVKANG